MCYSGCSAWIWSPFQRIPVQHLPAQVAKLPATGKGLQAQVQSDLNGSKGEPFGGICHPLLMKANKRTLAEAPWHLSNDGI